MTSLVAAFGLYFYVNAVGTERYLARRNLRVLGTLCRQLESMVDGFPGLLRNLDYSVKEAHKAGILPADFVEEQNRQTPYLDLKRVQRKEKDVTGCPAKGSAEASGIPGPWQYGTGLSRCRPADEVSAWGELRVEVRVTDVLRPFLVPGIFDEVLVLDAEGDALGSEGVASIRVEHLPKPAKSDTEAAGRPAAERASRVFETDIGGSAYTVFCQPLRLGTSHLWPPQGSEAGTVAGQPAEICGLISTEAFRRDSLALNPMVLTALVVILLILIVSWPFLRIWQMGPTESVSTLNLACILLALAAGTMVTTLVVVDWAAYSWLKDGLDRRLESLSREIKTSLAGEIDAALAQLCEINKNRRAIEGEVGWAGPQPCKATAARDKKTRPLIRNALCLLEFPRHHEFFDLVGWVDAHGMQQEKWSAGPAPTTNPIYVGDREYFSRVVEERLWSWPPEGSVQENPSLPSSAGLRFTLEPIRSRNTGQALAIVAMPAGQCAEQSPLGAAAAGQAPAVVTLAVPLVSLSDPVLPAGIDFAVLDEGGQVLFHSRSERVLEENFLEEVSDGGPLASAVFSRTQRALTAHYWGRDHRLFVTPIPGLPWTLVVFQDKEPLRFVNVQAVVVSASLLVILLALLGVLVLAAVLASPGMRLPRPWPNPIYAEGYLRLQFVLAVLGITFLYGEVAYTPRLLLASCYLTPLTALGFWLFILREAQGSGPRPWLLGIVCTVLWSGLVYASAAEGAWGVFLAQAVAFAACLWLTFATIGPTSSSVRRFLRRDTNYLRCAAMMLVLLAVLPAHGLFTIAWREQMELLVKHDQLGLAREMDARRARLRARFGDRSEVIDRRLCLTGKGFRDVYATSALGGDTVVTSSPAPADGAPSLTAVPGSRTAFLESSCATDDEMNRLATCSGPGTTEGALDLVDLWLPHMSGFTLELRALHRSGSSDGTWVWARRASGAAGGDSETICFSRDRRGDSPRTVIASPIPVFRTLDGVPGWIAVLTMALLPVLPLRWVARQFLLTGYHPPVPVTIRDLAAHPIKENLFIFCCPLAGSGALFQMKGIHVLDPRAAGGSPPPVPEAATVVCFDDVAATIAEPGSRKKLLETLEKLVAEALRPIVILASVDLDSIPPGPIAGAVVDPLLAEERLRWQRVLGRFSRLVVDDRPDAREFESRIDVLRDEALARAANPDERGRAIEAGRIEALYARLKEECARKEALLGVGGEVARMPGLDRLRSPELIRRIRDLADGYYRVVWGSLSDVERVLVYRLARGDALNPNAGRALERLLLQGLIRNGPPFHLMNESFRQFVLGEAVPEKVAAWSASAAPSLWAAYRVPLMMVILGLGAFLLYTQREVSVSTLAALSGILAVVPTITKVVELLRPAGTGGPRTP